MKEQLTKLSIDQIIVHVCSHLLDGNEVLVQKIKLLFAHAHIRHVAHNSGPRPTPISL